MGRPRLPTQPALHATPYLDDEPHELGHGPGDVDGGGHERLVPAVDRVAGLQRAVNGEVRERLRALRPGGRQPMRRGCSYLRWPAGSPGTSRRARGSRSDAASTRRASCAAASSPAPRTSSSRRSRRRPPEAPSSWMWWLLTTAWPATSVVVAVAGWPGSVPDSERPQF